MINSLKRVYVKMHLSIALFLTHPILANGIPVFDSANLAHQVKELAQLVEQVKQLKEQVNQARKQYESLTGTRDLGLKLYDPAINRALPEAWQQDYEILKNVQGISESVKDIINKEMYHGPVTEMQKHLLKRRQNTTAVQKALSLKAYIGTQKRLDQIESLLKKIDTTQDPKAIGELQARIAIEQAVLQNENNRLQLISQLHQAEDRLIREQREEMSRRILNPDNRGMPQIRSKFKTSQGENKR